MRKQLMINTTVQIIFSLLIACVLLLPQTAFAATTGTTALFRQVGSGSSSAVGDYISATAANGGMNQIYQFYLEVPPNTTQIVVRLFDADTGRGGGGGNHDWLQGGGYNTSCRYTLYTPGGATQWTQLIGSGTANTNNAWYSPAELTVASPAAGHWRLVSDMSSNATTGDDCNGWGFDVTGTGASVEIKAYALSFVPVGELDQTGATTTSTFYPYVTSGCSTNWKDFDGDTGTGVCSLTYRSRNGTISGTYSGSGSTVWLNQGISGYENDNLNIETGIWTWTGTYTRTGAGGGNFGVFYAGNYGNAGIPPTAQPQPGTFRIYLPSGTGNTPGGTPAKPVFSQKISFVSGPNPPINNDTTRVRVELIVFNPAVQAITFSAGNPVTAYVPGNGVVYAGNALASQGAVTVPASGGTGAVTWNPGTVNGGNTYATLYYEVNVTPTAATGPRYPVTGTPAANGTTARYLDETGNTTYTYGPLCELAVTRGGGMIPTWVAISCFEADMASGQPTVEWHTNSENGTVGFYLWRKDSESKNYQLVNPNFLPALTNAMTGGVYRLVDPGVQYGETVVYRLEEVNVRGDSLNYGPFTVTFDDTPAKLRETGNFYKKNSKEIPTTVNGFKSAVLTASEYEKTRQLSRRNVLLTQGPIPATQSSGQARIVVKSRGLFHIAAASIASALGMSVAQVEGLIASQKLSLSTLGEPVAWLADENRSGIYFYADNLESPYSDQNIYWLEQGSGLALEAVNGGNAAPAAATQTFNETSHYEENHYPLTSLFSNFNDDFWLWNFVVAGGESTSFPIQVPGPTTEGRATLTVNLHGASDTEAPIDHHVQVLLNGRQIGDSGWDGIIPHSFSRQCYQFDLIDGENTINIRGVKVKGVPYSYFYVDSFDLSYQRYYRAVNNTLWCQGDANRTISVTGFSDSQIMVWDVSQPRQPKLVSTAGIDLGGRITFIPAAPTNKYLLIGRSAALQPFSVKAASSVNLKQKYNSAEYLLIAPEEFVEEAQQLVDYRCSQGLAAIVVTMEDIYNNFNYGLASPLAIKDFLYYVYNSDYSQRKLKELKYAVLVGKGTFDYKDYLGYGDNLFPVILAGTSDGLFAADNLYGDLTGNDGIPEIAIGRLPVVSVEELRTVINKIKAYGNSQGPWTDKALLIADNADSGGDFLATSENLGKQLDGYAVDRLSLFGYSNSAEIRFGIIDGFNSGAALVNYVGHAGLDQLAQENIFNICDLPLLQNNSTLPIMILVACAAGRFDIPGYVCLSESLLLKGNGGIVTALAPTSAAFNSQSGLLVEEFYKAVFRAKEKDLGTAWLRAAKNFILQAGNPNVLNIFNILGDPAVMFK